MLLSALSVIIAGVASGVIGAIWFHPRVFGTRWMRAANVRPEQAAGRARGALLASGGFLASIVMASVLRMYIPAGMTTAAALSRAALLWVGCIATVLSGVVLWERKPISFYVLTAGYWLVALLVMAAVLSHLS